MAQILDGLKVSKEIKAEIKADVEKILSNGKRAPHLAAILVGNNGASETYVASKIKDCKEVGFTSSLYRFSSTASAVSYTHLDVYKRQVLSHLNKKLK